MAEVDSRKRFGTYDLVLCAIGAALITVCSWISLQVMDVPFTLQTMAVFIVLMTMGGKRGTISICVYLLLGAVGVPVFAGFKGGAQALMGPTGGFLVGFVFVGLVYWLFSEIVFSKFMKNKKSRFGFNIVIGVICEVVLYVFGVAWFMVVYAQSSGPVGIMTALAWCCFPFLIPDAVKLVAAGLISSQTYKIVRH